MVELGVLSSMCWNLSNMSAKVLLIFVLSKEKPKWWVCCGSGDRCTWSGVCEWKRDAVTDRLAIDDRIWLPFHFDDRYVEFFFIMLWLWYFSGFTMICLCMKNLISYLYLLTMYSLGCDWISISKMRNIFTYDRCYIKFPVTFQWNVAILKH